MAAIDSLTTAIFGLQRQIGQFATRLSAVEGRSSPSPSEQTPYGLPGYGGIPALPASTSVIFHTASISRPIPITSIPFPHSPSPIPHIDGVHRASSDAPEEDGDALTVPRFSKISFPSFDGKEDPLGWLNQCDHFF